MILPKKTLKYFSILFLLVLHTNTFAFMPVSSTGPLHQGTYNRLYPDNHDYEPTHIFMGKNEGIHVDTETGVKSIKLTSPSWFWF